MSKDRLTLQKSKEESGDFRFICAEVAQVVEHLTENQGVSGSTPLLGTAEVAEWQTRQSQKLLGGDSRAGSSPAFGTSAEWCSGSTRDFGSLGPGSNPGSAATH